MPIVDGYKATQRIRTSQTSYASIPIIAMTAHAFKGIREKCYDAGMNDYIAKPVQIDELQNVLSKWLPKK